jgi:hypothetical protein
MLSTAKDFIHLSDSWRRSSLPVAESILQAAILLFAGLLALEREQDVTRKSPDGCIAIVVATAVSKDVAIWRG